MNDLITADYVQIVNKNSGTCLQHIAKGTSIEIYACDSTNTNQYWKLSQNSDYSYYITNYTGYVIDDYDYGTTDGNKVQSWSASQNTAQRWYIMPVELTYFQLKSEAGSKCMDVYGAYTADGTAIDIWDCKTYTAGSTGSDNQYFYFNDLGS